MILATFSSLQKSYPSRNVLNGASGGIKDGERIALLGINGSGKTTLLEIMAGHTDFDFGSLEIPNSIKRGYLPQTIEVNGTEKLHDYAMSGMENLLSIKRRLDEIHNILTDKAHDQALLNELGNIQKIFESTGGYTMDSRAADVLRGLGFRDDEFGMKVVELSGGQRNRAALAKTLIGSPDLLLLDEPTNHLDISGLEYLESYMKSFKGGVLYVSHDRAFIQKTATTIWELTLGKIAVYPGNYENYLVDREKRLDTMNKTYTAQKEFIEKTEDFIRRNIAGQKTRQAQSRRKMLSKMERLERPPSASDVAGIRFSGAERSARIVVQAQDAGFAYNENEFILHDLNFEIERGERIGLVGPNGCGKTTLINIITTKFAPLKGRIELGKKLTIGYYDQLTENLNPDSTPLETIWEIKPELNEGQIRAYLARFLFRGDDVYRKVDSFSGGEQSRLALSRLIASAPNFLVLDEPTNHLDIPSREALELALAEFEGTVLCVSHDRYFLDRFAAKIFALEDGMLKIYLGNFSEYREKILNLAEIKKGEVSKLEVQSSRPQKAREKRVNPMVIQKLEGEITSLEEQIVKIENQLTAEEATSDWQKLAGLLNERERLYDELEKLYSKKNDLIGP
jgi:ATP-binding cassette, subfamily F, member 3